MKLYNKLALRNIKYYRMRSILFLIGVILSSFFVFMILGIGYSYNLYQTEQIELEYGASDADVNLNSLYDSVPILAELNRTEGIKTVSTGFLPMGIEGCEGGFYLNKKTFVAYSGMDFSNNLSQRLMPLLGGRYPQADGEFALENWVAHMLGLKIGDKYILKFEDKSKTFTLVGLLQTRRSSTGGRGWAVLKKDVLQKIYGVDDKVNIISIEFTKDFNIDYLKRRLGYIFNQKGDVRYNEIKWQVLKKQKPDFSGFFAVGAILLFAAGLFISNIFLISVYQRSKQLATLRSLGGDSKLLKKILLYEGLYTGMAGTIIGILLGVIFVNWLGGFIKIGFGDVFSRIVIPWYFYLITFLIGLIFTVLVTIVPIRRALSVRVMEVLRNIPVTGNSKEAKKIQKRAWILSIMGIGFLIPFAVKGGDVPLLNLLGGVGLIAFLGGIIMWTPKLFDWITPLVQKITQKFKNAAAKIAVKNVKDNIQRTVLTTATLVIGIALIISFVMIMESRQQKLEQDLAKKFPTSMILVSDPEPFEPVFANELRSLEGIKESTAAFIKRVYLKDFDFSKADTNWIKPLQRLNRLAGNRENVLERVIIVGIEADRFKDIIKPEITTQLIPLANLKKDQVYASALAAKNLGLSLGDRVKIQIGERIVEMQIVGIMQVGDIDQGSNDFYMKAEHFKELFSQQGPNIIYINSDNEESIEQLENTLQKKIRPIPDARLKSYYSQWKENKMKLKQLYMYYMGFVGVVILISLMSISTTMVTNIFERIKELGILKSIGMNDKSIRWMVIFESIYMSLVSCLAGVIAGLIIGVVILKALKTDFIYVPYLAIAFTFVGAILVGIGASAAPTYYTGKLSVVEALRYE
ncbi:hypothetical protein BBF96_12120 [Anoxybacter fermentans]|uniref:ABC3 transporter permease protein domain-containing protein n=1 Tax=Anoxybacter fermentans TaxID=1323375 RepID=A0A3S9T0E2_9FIRM|nr:FtsX-like permease family protein [Anoxybacter fermentans]AZR74076.1 hypothetical protein BBF96_12120 [Anoxybacter fermentans]